MYLENISNGGAIRIADQYIHPFSTITLFKTENNEYGLIDAGNAIQTEYLQNYFKRKNLSINDIKHIILTHVHLDHIYNSKFFPNATIYIHKKYKNKKYERFGEFLGKAYLEIINSWQNVVEINDGDILFEKIKIIHTPYHSSEHVSLWIQNTNLGNVVLPGDICYNRIDYYDIIKGNRTDKVAEILKLLFSKSEYIIFTHDAPMKI
jgi:glyoxylase-like metal-dependent hydrolase (beta-lactamase superfamily II)